MSEKTDEEYQREQKIIDETFPDAKFPICITPKEIDEVCCDGRTDVMIKHKCDCYYWDNCPHLCPTHFIRVKNTKPITHRMVLDALIENGFSPECNHIFYIGGYNIMVVKGISQ
jgi:hypothetical protein